MHYKATAQPHPRKVATRGGKLAGKLFEDAKRSRAAPLLFAAIARDFKGTDAAEDAEKALKEHPAPDGIVLERDVLRTHPALLGPTALDLDPKLLDGDPRNGELADKGVTLGDRELRLTMDAGGAERVETR